jgi:hypothetical protein
MTWVRCSVFGESSSQAAADYIHSHRKVKGEIMKRAACWVMLLAGIGGCTSVDGGAGGGPGAGPGPSGAPWAGTPYTGCASNAPPQTVPGMVGWDNSPLPMVAPYTSQPPRTAAMAEAMMHNNVPMDMVSQVSYNPAALEASGIRQAGAAGAMAPPGVPAVMPNLPAGGGLLPPGVVAGVGMNVPGLTGPFKTQRTEVRFVAPSGMTVSWFNPGPDGKNDPNAPVFHVPFRYNFNQAGIYRLKLTDIPGRAGVELYPTLDVVPTNARTAAFLAHSAVPITFTDEDFDQVISGNYVVKVIYLPDPQYQDLANIGGAGEIVSTRLEPGVDPIAMASSRGSILLVIRMGNIDLEAPNTPPMDAPNPFAPKQPACCPPGFPGMGMGGPIGGGSPLGPMVPYGMGGPGMPGMMSPGGGPGGSPAMAPQGPGAGASLPPIPGLGGGMPPPVPGLAGASK